jgi:hypothetical protein
MGPNLSAAAPEAAPGALFAEETPLRGGPNINLSGRCGSLRRWFHSHLSTVDGTTPGCQRSHHTVDVMPIVRVVKGGRQVTRRSDEREVGGLQL